MCGIHAGVQVRCRSRWWRRLPSATVNHVPTRYPSISSNEPRRAAVSSRLLALLRLLLEPTRTTLHLYLATSASSSLRHRLRHRQVLLPRPSRAVSSARCAANDLRYITVNLQVYEFYKISAVCTLKMFVLFTKLLF